MPVQDIPMASASAAEESIELPLFDISTETPDLGKKLVDAAARWGFLLLSNPAVTTGGSSWELNDQIVDNAFAISKKFFHDAPLEEKEGCTIQGNRGWVNMHVENLDPSKHKRGDFKQAFNLHEPKDGNWCQPMPATFQRHDAELRDFQNRCRNIANKVLRLLAIGLEIQDPDWLLSRHESSQNIMRLLFYPKLPTDTDYSQHSDIRAGAHSDYGSITLLFQRPSQPGLELLTSGGKWAAVPVFPPSYHSTTLPPIVVNIGDLLSNWTNGLLTSTIHRVILTKSDNATDAESADAVLGEDRFSIAVFVQPDPQTELVAMPSPLVQSRATDFSVGYGGGISIAQAMKTMTAGEHLESRLKATYGTVYQPQPKLVS